VTTSFRIGYESKDCYKYASQIWVTKVCHNQGQNYVSQICIKNICHW